ncbi:mobilization protein [uncultured Alistipes sp.]|uniref:plasmid mobilization protein n=1 Tax=uncultured Alistipes sp. TaxID=538949 RepID=UPI00320A8F55
MTGKKPRTPSYKYSFRLNEEQNIRFNELLCKAGSEHNRSRFIVKRIFGEEFVVVRRDPSTVQFVTRLNDFYFQFQRVAQNYNQVVKAINAHFSNVAIPHQIAVLEQRTRELKALSIEILNLVKKLRSDYNASVHNKQYLNK